jgi:cytochrome P450
MSVRGAGATCAMALHQFLAGLVREYQQNGGGPGVIGELCTMIGDDLTPEDVHMSCFDFVVAGYLSTTYLIASGIRSLLANPDQLEALRDDPAKMAGAIEELLRFEPPLQLVDRYAAYDTELGGVALKAGDRVTAVIGSADRDPAAFANPDALQIERADAAQMSFGAGIHYCIGAPLVRLAAPVAMAALIKLPGLAAEGLAQWQTDPYLRGLVNLPLRIG